MEIKKYQDIGTLLLRFTMAFTLLSAVASRLGFWGKYSSGWKNFLVYTSQVNSFAPRFLISFLAAASTVLEIILSVLLILGFKTRYAAVGSALLTFIYAAAMSYSFGIKSPLDYSVFTDSAANFLLASCTSYNWSLDEYLQKLKN